VNNPLFSVVIPTYNEPDLLEEALESVFRQTLADYEVIVVNDGSTDDTATRLARWASRTRIVEQANLGTGAARNRGMAEARGRYIAFLDHDDTWLPEKLRAQAEFFAAHPEAVGCTAPFAVVEEGMEPRNGFDVEIADASGIVRQALARYADNHYFLISSAIAIDRAKAGKLRYETTRGVIEDVPFQISLLLRGPWGVSGESVLVMHRRHAGNVSKSAAYFHGGVHLLRTIEKARGFCAEPQDERHIRRLIAAIARKMLVAQIAAGNRWRAFAGYFREFPHQARQGRVRFLALFPMLLMLPASIVRRLPRMDVRR
jgi:glycosyltransferase involved in cell wall biosynthesis